MDKYLAQACEISRSEARALVCKGLVRVNGHICKKVDYSVADCDEVAKGADILQRQEFVYLMMDKPAGVLSAVRDSHAETVVDLVRKRYPRRALFPVGRLDKDSTGLMLLTDDGAFAHAIMAPSRKIEKQYLVHVDCPVTLQVQEAFQQGVVLADGTQLMPAELYYEDDVQTVRIILRQGVYHQIKRMLGVYGIGVVALRRIAVGKLALDHTLGCGGFRALQEEEKKLIFA